MKTKREYRDFLEDILENAQKAQRFIEGIHFKDFKKNEEKIFAVVRALELIGEAALHIPKSIRSKGPNVPWTEMSGMRNKLAHEYFGVDLKVVWKTMKKDLPPLIEEIKRIIKNLDSIGNL